MSPTDTAGPTRSGAEELAFAGISHRYATRDGDVTALEDVNLTFAAGRFVCVVGPSGCGKSTLMEIAAGLRRSTQGEVRLGGRTVTEPRREAAMVFQQPALFAWKTVLGNVTAGLRARKVSREAARERAMAQLEVVGLADSARRYPHELSGGMAQRVGIARALALDPSLLLMDEPFAAVDAQTRGQLQQDLLTIMDRRAMTVLFVTHDVSEAVYLGDEIVVMTARPGRVAAHLTLSPESRDQSSVHFSEMTSKVRGLLDGSPKETM